MYRHTHIYMLQTSTLILLIHYVTYSLITHVIKDSVLYSRVSSNSLESLELQSTQCCCFCDLEMATVVMKMKK